MDIQNEIRRWIAGQLQKAGHGSKGRLALHLGVRADAITRMLNTGPGKETRVIRADELVKIQEFFGSTPPRMNPTDEQEFFTLYEAASPDEREAVKAFLKTLSGAKRK